jgi:hypothetical protein
MRSTSTPISSVVAHNLLGQKVLSVNNFNQQELNLDVSHLDTGVYLVTVNNTQTLKLVIE